jgi:Transposase domain (DUF772)
MGGEGDKGYAGGEQGADDMSFSRRSMTKSPMALAREAMRIAEGAMPAYSHRYSPKKFSQHQLFAILVVREFLGLDYRGTEVLLREWSDLRQLLGLDAVPDHSTLEKAEKRLLKKGGSPDSLTRSSSRPVHAA